MKGGRPVNDGKPRLRGGEAALAKKRSEKKTIGNNFGIGESIQQTNQGRTVVEKNHGRKKSLGWSGEENKKKLALPKSFRQTRRKTMGPPGKFGTNTRSEKGKTKTPKRSTNDQKGGW